MNKTIWINWFQGWDNAPEISKKCVESWKYYNPGWEVVLLDKDTYRNYTDFESRLPGLNTNNISLSDILRVSLLKENGGVWADSTLWCNKPLDDWIHEYDDSFLFTRADDIANNWFMMAKPDSYLFNSMYENTIDWWTYRIKETDQFEQLYGWWSRNLRQIISKDQRALDIFRGWDHINCTHDIYNRQRGYGFRGLGPHGFTPYFQFFYEPITDEFKNRIDAKIDPVYKLTYKEQTDWKNNGIHPDDRKITMNYPKGTQLDYLLNTVI